MTKEEKFKILIQRGYVYNPESGLVYNRFGKLISIKNVNNGYLMFGTSINNKHFTVSIHQFAWYCVYKECVKMIDHINRNKTDNKITNLRSVTRNQNMWNLNCKGYTYHKKSNKWQAQILIYRKFKYLGLFKTEEEARNAYLAAKEKYHVI